MNFTQFEHGNLRNGTDSAGQPRDLKKLFEYIFIFFLIGAGIAAFFRLCLYPGGDQRNLFFLDPDDYFMDFFNVVAYAAGGNPYMHLPASESAYPPLNYLMYYPLAGLGDYQNSTAFDVRNSQLAIMSLVIFLVFCSVVLGILFYEIKNGSRRVR